MKRIAPLLLLILPMLLCSSFKSGEPIEWMSLTEAIEMNKQEPKFIFMDIYTDWCGWCKKMDQTTFVTPKITELMNKYFYAVKFDAEQKEKITFKGDEFEFVSGGRRGYHQLAAAILHGKMSYPSYAAFDENLDLITVFSGYQSAQDLEPILAFLGEKRYKSQTFEEYLAERAESK
ncbi:DUF255 domain-containing protein [bacterium]|nr:DUF255 domain-containing protein [bacterium]